MLDGATLKADFPDSVHSLFFGWRGNEFATRCGGGCGVVVCAVGIGCGKMDSCSFYAVARYRQFFFL